MIGGNNADHTKSFREYGGIDYYAAIEKSILLIEPDNINLTYSNITIFWPAHFLHATSVYELIG